MATSKITIYQTKLEPGLNAKVDDIEYYLNHTVSRKIYNECQYQKLELEFTIKVEMEQKYHFGSKGYNYLKLEQDKRPYYFFILGSKWKASNTVELSLSMDTINTFLDNMEFDNKTKITRQHKDRFVRDAVPQSGFITLVRKIDKTNECINPTKYYDGNKRKIYDEDLQTIGDDESKSKWYLIYRANSNLTTESQDANNPVELLITSDYPFLINGLTTLSRPIDYPAYIILEKYNSPETKIFADNVELPAFGTNLYSSTTIVRGWIWYRDGKLKYIYENGNGEYIIQGGSSLTTATNLTTSTGFRYGKAIKIDNVPDAFNYGDYQLTEFVGNRLQTIDTINRTESRYMKILEIPYPPIEFTFTQDRINIPDGWYLRDGMLYTDNVEKNFYRLVGVQPLDMMKYNLNASLIRKTDSPIIEMESKLYSSEFYDFNICYDSFEKQYLLERFNATKVEDCEYQIMFKPTNTINSNFLFEFYDLYEVYKELDVRSQYMNVKRNVELSLYNSDYLSYIRTGYNYDVKNKNAQVAVNTIGAVSNVGGTVVSSFKGGEYGVATSVGFAINAFNAIINAVHSAKVNERAIQQKLEQLKNSPSSVNGSDDLDLMNYVTSNKLEEYTNSCSEEMKKAVFEMLRLTGYNCNEYGVPNTNSRLWFNFLQCEPSFVDEELLELPKDVLDDIKTRYAVGVTYFHKVDNQYSFDREFENYETWMITR